MNDLFPQLMQDSRTMNKVNIINGILLASRNELTGHTENATVHVTQEERERWNAGLVQDGSSGELTEKEIQTVVDKRLYDAGVIIKRISPEEIDIPVEGGRVEVVIDTNVPLSGRRFVPANSDPTHVCIPPYATLMEERPDLLAFSVEPNPSIDRVWLHLELYACEPASEQYYSLGIVTWHQHGKDVHASITPATINIPAEGGECDLEVRCDYEWRLLPDAMPGFTFTPSSGQAGTTTVHLTTPPSSSGSGEDFLLRLIVTDGKDTICAFIATIVRAR